MLKKESLCERLSTAFPSQTSKGIQVHFIHFRRFSSRLRKDGGRKSGIVWKVKILLRKGPVSSDGGTNGNSANVFAFFFFFNNDHISQNVLREKKALSFKKLSKLCHDSWFGVTRHLKVAKPKQKLSTKT